MAIVYVRRNEYSGRIIGGERATVSKGNCKAQAIAVNVQSPNRNDFIFHAYFLLFMRVFPTIFTSMSMTLHFLAFVIIVSMSMSYWAVTMCMPPTRTSMTMALNFLISRRGRTT
jgi:hypothetical protein